MIALNLTATGAEQTILKDYLENNVSEVLADKINNGVRITKDGKTLINKKDLTTFMKYACEEAQKQAEKGARSACIEGKTVFGWAIHYFEEDSIEGTLYNEDGTECKPPKPAARTIPQKTTPPAVTTPPKPKTQFSLFDLMDGQSSEPATEQAEEEPETDESENGGINESEIDETEEPEEPQDEEQYPVLTQISENKYVDQDGVIYNEAPKQPQNTELSALLNLFGDTLIVR